MDETPNEIELLPFSVKIKHLVETMTANEIKDTEFRANDMPFISIIGKNDGISQKDISSILDFDKSYTTRVVSFLISSGTVENIATGKTHSLRLTEKGKEGLEISDKVQERVMETIFKGFTEEEIETFITLSKRINNTISNEIKNMQ